MSLVATTLVALVALEHLYILYIEMFAWTTLGRRVFKGAMPDELFEKTQGLAANQGLYNGFLAAGLIWSLLVDDSQWAFRLQVFFLGCVITAALYGAVKSSRAILWKQGMPAILAMLAVWIAHLT